MHCPERVTRNGNVVVLDGPLSFEEVPNAASRHIEEVVRVAVFGLKKWDDTVQSTTRL